MTSTYNIQQITSGPKFHFKPYYDMQPWDVSGRYFLCMESDFQDRPPGADDSLTLGLVDLKRGNQFIELTKTKAWNFQQGCMPHWLPGSDGKIIYNDRVDREFHAIVLDIHTREKVVLPKPIQAVSPYGEIAACLNFARWGEWRPGYGYAGLKDSFHGQNQPAEDAVYLMNPGTGEHKPVVFLEDIARLTSDNDKRNGSAMWFCHLMFNTDGTRLAGLVRWWCPAMADTATKTKVNIDGAGPQRRHCLWVINIAGIGLDIIADNTLISHAEWHDPDHILFWGNARADESPAYVIVDVRDKSHDIIGKDVLLEDGHMSYHKNKKWLLTDTYPDERYIRELKLYNIDDDREIVLGRFYAPPDLKGELRCDLHPCWNRDYTQVAIDSIHDNGERQVYVVEVGALT